MGVREYRRPVKSAGSSNPTLTNDSHPFGEYGEGYLRMCYANSVENIQVALQRLSDLLGG